MLLTNQINLDLLPIIFPSFVPTPETFIFIFSILFSVIVVSVGPIIQFARRKFGETVAKNVGNIVAVAALTDTALNIYNTIQINKERQGGGGYSGNTDNGDNSSKEEDESSKDKSKNQIKKDNPSAALGG